MGISHCWHSCGAIYDRQLLAYTWNGQINVLKIFSLNPFVCNCCSWWPVTVEIFFIKINTGGHCFCCFGLQRLLVARQWIWWIEGGQRGGDELLWKGNVTCASSVLVMAGRFILWCQQCIIFVAILKNHWSYFGCFGQSLFMSCNRAWLNSSYSCIWTPIYNYHSWSFYFSCFTFGWRTQCCSNARRTKRAHSNCYDWLLSS